MDELGLLKLRLEDLSEVAENKEVKLLAKALLRYYKKKEIGFKAQ